MPKNKLSNVLTRSSNQTHKAIKRGKLHSTDTSEEVVASTEFSRELASTLSPSIVSIASFDGEKLHSVSTGILVFMNHIGTSILTSPGLVTTSHTKGRFNPMLQIKVRLPNNEVVHGDVEHYDLPYKILLVTTCPFPDLRVACFGDHMQVESCTELLAVRRCFNSGKIMAASGVLVDSPSGVDSEGVMFSTCKLTVDGSGGPLVALDGNIVGMNGYHDCERGITPFLPRNRFLEFVRRYGIISGRLIQQMQKKEAASKEEEEVKAARVEEEKKAAAREEKKKKKKASSVDTLVQEALARGLGLEGEAKYSLEDFKNPLSKNSVQAIDKLVNAMAKKKPGGKGRERKPVAVQQKEAQMRYKNLPHLLTTVQKKSPIKLMYLLSLSQKNALTMNLRISFVPGYLMLLLIRGHESLQPVAPEFTEIVNGWLRKSGYPLPSFFNDGMYLKGDFEEGFGKDIWSESIRRVALKMSRSVVALASFNDKGERYFACTGVFIECNESTTRVLTSASLVRTSGDENKIDDNLRIEVCLPSKRRITGTLQHYSLRYNVAVVRINGFRNHRAAKLNDSFGSTEVVALGCVFEFGKLMATDGVVTHKQSRLNCKELQMSTCKISKAGIGGPLVNSDGNLVGMNFYDMEETPYLPTNIILEVMSHFHAERTGTAGTMVVSDNYRWPVPEPYWYYPSRYRGLNLNIKDEEILE